MRLQDVVGTAKRTLQRFGLRTGGHVEGEAVRLDELPARSSAPAAADVIERPHGDVIVLDVPGATRASTEITLEGRTLRVVARRLDTSDPDALDWCRSFVLSDHVDVDALSAEMKDGVLEIHLPKVSAARPRRVRIGGAVGAS